MVNKITIMNSLISMMNNLKTQTDSDQGIQIWADQMSSIIMDAILSADVQAGIPVATAGSATAQTGSTISLGSLL
jgi:hypothetical protein